jgi:hypothetical protein
LPFKKYAKSIRLKNAICDALLQNNDTYQQLCCAASALFAIQPLHFNSPDCLANQQIPT